MKKDCVYEAKCYAHGAALNMSGQDMICKDGKWEKEPPGPGLTIGPGEGMSDI